ncbi:hypothetical protein Tco_0303558 [Tanacetum coccineum]
MWLDSRNTEAADLLDDGVLDGVHCDDYRGSVSLRQIYTRRNLKERFIFLSSLNNQSIFMCRRLCDGIERWRLCLEEDDSGSGWRRRRAAAATDTMIKKDEDADNFKTKDDVEWI